MASGATPATTGANELALGLYADSGFGDALSSPTGWSPRVNISKVGDMELLAEDQVVPVGATPNASVTTGANTYWLMSTVVLKNATAGQTAQISQALLSGGPASRIRRGAGRGTMAATVGAVRTAGHHRDAVTPLHCGARHLSGKARRACASLRHAAAVAKRDRRHWIYEALLENLSPKLLCHHWDGHTLRGLQGLAAGWYAAR